MKYIGMIGLIISSTAIGLHLSEKSRKKVAVCNELLKFCDMLSLDLEFYATPIKQLLKKILADDCFANLEFVSEENIKMRMPVHSVLSKSENEQISQFLFSLGKSDVKGQIKLVNSFKEYINQSKEKYSEKHKKDSKIYLTFGFFSGVILSLVFL